ncbi:complement C1q-like protein 4 isoform X2 [Simochromis diagramma]|uniref:complement C1q-like protein 4 isoform X2 n=1 Tax=Simochromis diagramma TaxID=43689 RepID=UPI001A7E76A2|nr:complement C1q-like protein 4 isoform X2 [Simochromis diagramma]
MTVIQQVSVNRMKIIMFLPLLLLVCSVSADQTETAGHQSCPQDFHAALRELTASLAVQNERITVLQTENQELEAKLESQKTEINQLKQLSEEQAGKLKTELQNQRTEANQMKQQQHVTQVAFSASLLDQGEGDTGPFNDHTTLVFKHVVTNIGNAYNKNTGIFTAPVRGAYHFDWKVLGRDSTHTGAYLFRNEEIIFLAYESQSSGWPSASNGASLLLEVGDQVTVRLWAGSRTYDNENHQTTFSGHLIFTM